MDATEYRRKYRKEHKEQIRILQRRWNEKNREKIRRWHREYYQKNREKELLRCRQYKRGLKIETLAYYGNGKTACVICGESRIGCLSIDHTDGGGNIHRRQLVGKRAMGSNNFYLWLKRQGYPNGYRTLCMNCQFLEMYPV